MSTSPDHHDLSPSRFLHQHCQGRHGNLTTGPTTSLPESSTGEEGEGKDTDFGAVLYIAAVLVFYSLGIVVMIIKYLKTERKEMEEEIALDHFFKNVPSKRIEHSRDEVNRVAIRAFHTLTSAAKKKDQLLAAAQASKQITPDGDWDPTTMEAHKPAVSPHSDDSDSSRGDRSPYLLREPTKHLPRVSLIFRDNSRSNERRKVPDNSCSKSGLSPLDNSRPPPGQRSPQVAFTPLQENGQARFCVRISTDHSDHSDSSLTSPTSSSHPTTEKQKVVSRARHQNRAKSLRGGQPAQKDSVVFVEERGTREKAAGKSKASRGRARSPRSSRGHSRAKLLNTPSTSTATEPTNLLTTKTDIYNNHVSAPNAAENGQADCVNTIENSQGRCSYAKENSHVRCADAFESNQGRSTEGPIRLLKSSVSSPVLSNGCVTPAERPRDSSGKLTKAMTCSSTQVTLSSEQGLVQTTLRQDSNPRTSILPKTLLVSDV